MLLLQLLSLLPALGRAFALVLFGAFLALLVLCILVPSVVAALSLYAVIPWAVVAGASLPLVVMPWVKRRVPFLGLSRGAKPKATLSQQHDIDTLKAANAVQADKITQQQAKIDSLELALTKALKA